MSLSLPNNAKFSSITSPRKNKFVSSKNKSNNKADNTNESNISLSYAIPREFKDEELKQKKMHLECDLPDYSVENIKVLSLSQNNVRNEMKALEKWTTMKLHEIHCRYEQQSIEPRQKQSLEQINILDTAMSQLTKQLEVQCMEQSLLIRKLWSSSADLFQSIYQELSSALSTIQNQLNEKIIICESLQDTIKTLNPFTQTENQTQVLLLEKELLFQKIKHHQIQNQLESELLLKNQEMLSLQDTITKISLWFPNFTRFSSSVLSDYLPPIKFIQLKNKNDYTNDKNEDKELKIANYYLIEDLKRLQEIGNGIVILDAEEYDATLKIMNQKDLLIQQYLKLRKIPKRNRKPLNNNNNTSNTTANTATTSTTNTIINNTTSTSNTTTNSDNNNESNNINATVDNKKESNDNNKEIQINIKDMNELSDVLMNALNRTIYNHNLKQKLINKKKSNKHYSNTRESYSEITPDDMLSYHINNTHQSNNNNTITTTNDNNGTANNTNKNDNNTNNNDNNTTTNNNTTTITTNDNDSSSNSSNNSNDDYDDYNSFNINGTVKPPSMLIQTDMRVSEFYKLQSKRFTEISKKI